jgi:phage gp29-like protein
MATAHAVKASYHGATAIKNRKTPAKRQTDPMEAASFLAGSEGAPVGLNKPTTAGPPGGGLTTEEMVRRSNFWRDNYNPLRGLTMARLMALFEQAERGAFAEIQLTLRKVEKRFPVLKGFVEKLLSNIEELDGKVRDKEQLPEGGTPEMAEKQRKFLQGRYDLLKNFKTSVAQIALADIRGYAVLQKHRFKGGENDGAVEELYWLEPWCWVREGFYGDFYYNPNSQFGIGLGTCQGTLGEDNRIGSDAMPRADFIIRESESPLYEIALIAFMNWLMGRKDYGAFIEIFGLPNSVVIMPPNIPTGKELVYQSSAEKVAQGVSGALPAGSDVKFPTSGVRGNQPFEAYCGAQEKDFVLAGTGGHLTMLQSDHGGLGKGGAEEHDAAWKKIAVTKAVRINDTLQRDFDIPELAGEFPGEPVCVEFALSIKDEEDVSEVLDNAVKCEGIGLQTDVAEISDRTGLKLTRLPAAPGGNSNTPNPDDPLAGAAAKADLKISKGVIGAAVRNRAAAEGDAKTFYSAVADDLQLLRQRVAAIETISDPDLRKQKLQALLDDWDELTRDITADPETARALEKINGAAVVAGMNGHKVTNRWRKILNGGPGSGRHPGDGAGKIPEGKAPPRISVADANRELSEGKVVTDSEGVKIRFGTEMQKKISDDRKVLLEWGKDTVGAGVKADFEEKGEQRTRYGKIYQDDKARRAFQVLVDTKDGYAFNMHILSPKQLSGKLENREGANTDEQPSAGVLQAMAAAGSLPDWFKFNPDEEIVNP